MPNVVPVAAAPAFEEHHRDIQGGAARAAVFGVMDGLVSNVGLILGVAGAGPAAGVVRLAGLGGLVAGAVSMAAGEYNSVKAQTELFEHELEMERIELARNPEHEVRELAEVYEARGMPGDRAHELAEALMKDPAVALEVHAREELGVDPGGLGNPVQSAVSSFFSFCAGAIVPLAPWFVASGTAAIWASVAFAIIGAVVVGIILARFTGRSPVRTSVRHLVTAGVAAGIGYLLGNAVGVGV